MSITFTSPVEAPPKPGTIEYEAARMDRLFPGWYDRIDIETLNMQSCEHCIVGQSAGWDNGFMRIFDDRVSRDEHYLAGQGFYAASKHKAAWIAEIERRRA
jgi:hypothetical protein